MTAPPLKKSRLACLNKHRHPDEFTARAAAMHQIQWKGAPVLYVYQCDECRGWHLTRRNHGNSKKVTADNPVQPRQIPRAA